MLTTYLGSWPQTEPDNLPSGPLDNSLHFFHTDNLDCKDKYLN